MKYILGVDGGNTKTDYFLFDINNNFIGHYRGGTCSHEGLSDSFEGSYRVMKGVLDEFLPKYNVKVEDIVGACFGLAGDDIPSQQVRLDEVVTRLGFKNFVVVNDSMLGVKAGTSKGYGVCSINGTGTSASGIGIDGETLQVGGIGDVSGDDGGGRYIARCVVRAAYEECYRCGDETSLTPIVMKGLEITDKKYFLQQISELFYKRSFDYNQFTIACFEEANKGDKVAIRILERIGECLGGGAAGLALNIKLDDKPEFVLAGSVYVKGSSPVLVNKFKETVKKNVGSGAVFNVLQVPPATGAIIWAKELYTGSFPSLEEREQLISIVSNTLNNQK